MRTQTKWFHLRVWRNKHSRHSRGRQLMMNHQMCPPCGGWRMVDEGYVWSARAAGRTCRDILWRTKNMGWCGHECGGNAEDMVHCIGHGAVTCVVAASRYSCGKERPRRGTRHCKSPKPIRERMKCGASGHERKNIEGFQRWVAHTFGRMPILGGWCGAIWEQ